jgi:hypothetical protein
LLHSALLCVLDFGNFLGILSCDFITQISALLETLFQLNVKIKQAAMAPPKHTMKSVEVAAASKKTLNSTFFKKRSKGKLPRKHGLATYEITIVGGGAPIPTPRKNEGQLLNPRQ